LEDIILNETELLHSLGTIEKFAKNQTIFSQHETDDEMYVVLKGTFGVFIDSFTGFPIRVAEIGQGSFFGEMAIIDGSPRSATIISEDDAVAVKIRKPGFMQLLEKAPNMTSAIIKTLRNRADRTAESVREAGKDAPGLPASLTDGELKDSNCILQNLTMLAGYIRQMNDLLARDTISDESLEDGDIAKGNVRLLPESYNKYNITDLKENKDTFRVLAVSCPYCFTSLTITVPKYGMLGNKKEKLDGRVFYSNLNLLLYTNTVCTNCNYTDTYSYFGIPRKTLEPPRYTGNQFENIEGFKGYDRSMNRTVDEAILSYYLNIECLKRTSGEPLRFANAWIRLYWLYSDQGSKDFALDAAKQAYHYYTRYLEQGAGAMAVDD